MVTCTICKSPSATAFKKLLLGKYQVTYYRCGSCGFIQTETPYWLEEAYSKALSSLDVGIIRRNQDMTAPVSALLNRLFGDRGRFLDFAGGSGMFTRLMRDKGFDFYHHDKYCENVFARFFGVEEIPAGEKFDLLTAFEVFEHLIQPVEEMSALFSQSDSVFFSTELVPEEPEHWWYLTPETGQHIAFYTKQSLAIIAGREQCHFYSNGRNLHLFSKKRLFDTEEEFKKIIRPLSGWEEMRIRIGAKLGINNNNRRKSFTQTDFDSIKLRLAQKK